LRIVTVVGARPQFIKAAMLNMEFEKHGIEEILVHTGQHFDSNMSGIFFQELGLSEPQLNLHINSDTNTVQTARVMIELEKHIREMEPSAILVYGDTNATLAGAMVGAQLQIPVFHVEAGLRSFDRRMPEEINRVLTDNLSTLLFCPTDTAVRNLAAEGRTNGVYNVGDIMYDAVMFFSETARKQSTILEELKVQEKGYILATVHRNFNTDHDERLEEILKALGQCSNAVVWPLHPRTRKMISQFGLDGYLQSSNIIVTEPLGYIDMIRLQSGAKVIVTDSGGVQKEAYFNGVPSVILRENTEWVELIESGWGQLAEIGSEAILSAIASAKVGSPTISPFGKGKARIIMAQLIRERISVQ
jgi:UDP-GlcNAc3NAcA epimerase